MIDDQKKVFIIVFSLVACGIGVKKYLTEKHNTRDKNIKTNKLYDFTGLARELHKNGTVKYNQNDK